MRFELVNRFLKNLRIRALSERTLEAYGHDLKIFTGFLNRNQRVKIEEVGKEHIRLFIEHLDSQGLSAASKARKIACLRSFFKYLYVEEIIARNPVNGTPTPRINQKEVDYLTEQKAGKLLRTVSTCAGPYYKSRDVAMITIFLYCGLRLSELVGIDKDDLNLEEGTMKVKRKGGDEQQLPISEQVKDAVKRYLRDRDDDDPALFLSKRGSRIHKRTVTHLVKKYLEMARFKKDRLSPHLLRHSFCSFMLKNGTNIAVIQKLMNHKSLATTQRYLHVADQDLKNAVERIVLNG